MSAPSSQPAAKATRDAFGSTIQTLGETEPRIVVFDADLSGSTRSAKFAQAHPERFFEMGIQEANMIGVATGMATCGKIAFVCSFSCFVTGRFDQIKCSIAYNDARVTIVGTHCGVGVGPDGYTQMSLEDVAMLRALPNMAILQPADDLETEQMVKYLVAEHDGPAFLRLTRQKVPRIHDGDYAFTFGKVDVVRDGGDDLVICATGACTHAALDAAARLADRGIATAVLNVPTIKPLDTETLAAFASKTKRVMTVEDHSVDGGLGSAVCEALSETSPTRVHRVGLRTFGESGSPEELYRKFHLDAEGVYDEASQFVERTA